VEEASWAEDALRGDVILHFPGSQLQCGIVLPPQMTELDPCNGPPAVGRSNRRLVLFGDDPDCLGCFGVHEFRNGTERIPINCCIKRKLHVMIQ
jgi:hypothetical protein